MAPVPSLGFLCREVAKHNIDQLAYVGDFLYESIQDLIQLVRSGTQLKEIETNSPQIMEHTNADWKRCVEREFPSMLRSARKNYADQFHTGPSGYDDQVKLWRGAYQACEEHSKELDDKAAELLAASYAKARETKLNNSTSLVDHKLVPQPRKTKQPTPGQTTLQKIKRATRAEAKNVKMIQDQARHQVAVIQRHQQAQRSMAIAKPKHVSVAASAKKTFQREHVACTAEQTGAFDSALSARSQVHLAKVDEEGKRLRQQLREMDATKRGLTVTAAQNPAAQSITTNSPPRSATKPAKKGHALLFKNKPIEQTPGYMGTYSVIINKDGSKTKTRIDAPSTSSKSPPAAASSPPQRVASAAPVDGVSPMSLSSATPASSTPSSPPSDVGHGPLRPLKRRRAPVDVFVKKPRY